MENTKFGGADGYFNHVQMPVIRKCRPGFRRVLEIGCGAGAGLAYLKGRGAEFVTGLELSASAAEEARKRPEIDRVVVADIASGEVDAVLEEGAFDLIIASFVLEHVIDPWAVVRKMKSLLVPGGQLVGALPNVRHVSVSVPLLFSGKWKYVDEGIMDWTHAKFFSKETIRDLLASSGFRVDSIDPWVAAPSRSSALDRLTLGLFSDLLCFAYTFSATKS